MSALRILSLCSGYGGLDLAVEAVLGAVTVAHAEIEPAACAVLEQRWPGVPNIGDLKLAAAWNAHWWRGLFEIVTAGYPCQPFSTAGRRKGTDDPRHLWPYVAATIRGVRPRLVVLENVAGHRTLGLDVVLGDLAALGYDATWTSIRAADVGAPHGRERLFIVAQAADAQGDRWDQGRPEPARLVWRPDVAERSRAAAAESEDVGHERRRTARDRWAGSADGGVSAADAERGELQRRRGPGTVGSAPATPSSARGERQRDGHTSDRCGPATRADVFAGRWCACEAPADPGDDGRSGGPQLDREPEAGPRGARRGHTDGRPGATVADAAEHGPVEPSGDGRSAAVDGAEPGAGARAGARGTAAGVQQLGRGAGVEWGPYGPAIERWERFLGRVAPAPTEPGPRGGQRLSPRFVEWMMGLPAGWVTDVPGISRNAQLKMLGNGVVPQQAAAALRWLLSAADEREAA